MNYFKLFVLASLILAFTSCEKKTEVEKEEPKELNKIVSEDSRDLITIAESFVSSYNDEDNVDSPTFWQGKNGENWLIATTKESDMLFVYNAESGEMIKKVAGSGKGKSQLDRPNGIWVIDDYLFVVERNNHRVQVFDLPDFNHVGFIAEDKLIWPYGLCVYKEGDSYQLFITDNYETEEGGIPADSLLDKRVLNYKLTINDDKLNSEFVRYIGEKEGEGRLTVVESIYADPEYNRLMIAEENEEFTSYKVYNLNDGTFSGTVIGEGIFQNQAEGIALYDCGMGEGFWIMTDQGKGDNAFYVYNRRTLEFVNAFYSETTQNTDGIWVTNISYGNFNKGALLAVHDDGAVSGFDWNILEKELGFSCE